MKLEFSQKDAVYVLHRDDGSWIALTVNEVAFIGEQVRRSSINDRIKYALEDAVNDGYIDLSRGDISAEDFLEEVRSYLEERIDYQDSVSDEEIEDALYYIADSYEVRCDE